MDKNLHNIENLFRKTLEDNEEVPSQKAWEGIEQKLDKENIVSIKKKYDLLKKVSLLLLFLLAVLSIYVWKFQNNNSVKPNKDISEINKEPKTKKDTLTKESGRTTLRKGLDTLTLNKNSNSDWDSGTSHKIINKTILKDENVGPKDSLNSVTAENISIKTIPKNKIKFKNTDESLLSDVSRFSIQKKGKKIKSETDEVVESKKTNQIKDKLPVSVIPSNIQSDLTLPITETLNPKNVGNIKSITTLSFATRESLLNLSLAKINPFKKIDITIVLQHSIKSMDQSRFAITAFYSPDITFFHYKNNDQGNSNNSNFKNSEAENFSSTFGAFIDYKVSKHWGLQSGITLSTSNFDLESKTIYAQLDNSGVIQYKLSTPLGDAFLNPSFGNNPSIGDSIFSKSITHTLQYIGIPLSIKYYLSKGKFTFNLLGGIKANFLSRGRITTELESGNDKETEITDKIYGLKPFYVSGLSGVGLDYNIYKKFSLSFFPTLRFALSAINSNVKEQSYPTSLGFVLGLKMEL